MFLIITLITLFLSFLLGGFSENETINEITELSSFVFLGCFTVVIIFTIVAY